MDLFSDENYGQLSPMQQLLRAPETAGAMQALNNISMLRRDQVPRMTPVQAYQNQVVAQATANQQRRINDLTIQQREQQLNPFYEYEQAKARGIIPEEMSWAEWQNIARPTASRRGFAPVLGEVDGRPTMLTSQYDPGTGQYTFGTHGLPEGFRKDRAITEVDRGDVIEIWQGNQMIGTRPRNLKPSEEVDYKADVVDAEKWAGIDADWETAYNQSMPNLDQALDLAEDMITFIENNPDMPTGMIQGYITPRTDAMVSALQTGATLLAIPRLQEAKLNPVTELELQKIMETFADALKDPKANLASMKVSYNEFLKDVAKLQEQQEYYNRTGSMKGYATRYTPKQRTSYEVMNQPDEPEVDLEGL